MVIFFHTGTDEGKHILVVIDNEDGLYFICLKGGRGIRCFHLLRNRCVVGPFHLCRQFDGKYTTYGFVVADTDGAMMQMDVVAGNMKTNTASCL